MRVYLNGEGDPIPIQALPDSLPVSDRPPLAFMLDGSEPFPVEEYRLLGYTNFEVICIGAAGGRGGDSKGQVLFDVEKTTMSVPQNIWDLVLERAMLEDYIQQNLDYNSSYNNNPNWYTQTAYEHQQYGRWPTGFMPPPVLDRVYTGGDTEWHGAYPYNLPDDHTAPRWGDIVQEFQVQGLDPFTKIPGFNEHWDFTYKQMFEWLHPTHQRTFTVIKNVRLGGGVGALGGAGGGGGRHVVGGLLADLPAVVPVVVGQVGADAEPGQVIQEGLIAPELTDPKFSAVDWPWFRWLAPDYYSTAQKRVYEINNLLIDYTVTYPEPHPSFPNPQAGGDGGASSFGDICKASGGKGGIPSFGWPGGVKTFLGYGGAGGLGNRLASGGGGAGSTASGIPGADGPWDLATGIGGGGGGGLSGSSSPLRAASNGGRGSYSFADPTKYGPRQQKSGLFGGGGGGALLIPGTPAQYYGSRALGSNPNGAVYLRLTKVD